jgi:drug/metabolite transporter (DMT)-like permease
MSDMKPIHYGALLLLGAIWGASFLFISVAVHELSPSFLMFVRVLIAGLVLLVYALILKSIPDWRRYWRVFLIVGLFNSALPFTLIALSEKTLSASMAAILNSTTPLFTALLASLWGRENLSPQKMLGIVLGIIGVIVLVGGSPLDSTTEFYFAVGYSLLAALCYGIGTVYASRNISGKMPGLHASIGQMFGAALVLTIPAATAIPTALPSMNAIWALAALTLVSTSFAYLIYFYLLQNVGATRTASVTFLVPVFGSIWGIIFMQNAFNWWMLLGMLIIFTSVSLVMGIGFGKAKIGEAAKA